MMGQYIADQIAAVMREHGQDMTLRRRVDVGFDSLDLKGKLISGAGTDLDGEAGAVQRIRISHAEIAASTLSGQLPAEKDQIVVGGITLSIVAVTTLREGNTIAAHDITAVGPSV